MIIRRIRPLANHNPQDLASCKWSFGGSSHLKWSSRGSDLLQMIIWRIWPLSNDHPEDPATCKWSSEGSSLLQMIIQRIRPLAIDHPGDPATCKWSYGGIGWKDRFNLLLKKDEKIIGSSIFISQKFNDILIFYLYFSLQVHYISCTCIISYIWWTCLY